MVGLGEMHYLGTTRNFSLATKTSWPLPSIQICTIFNGMLMLMFNALCLSVSSIFVIVQYIHQCAVCRILGKGAVYLSVCSIFVSVHCAVYSSVCSIFVSVQYTRVSVQYICQCTVYSSVCSVKCAVCSIFVSVQYICQCAVYSIFVCVHC